MHSGASVLRDGNREDRVWASLVSPEVMEFCVTVEAIGNSQVLAFENRAHALNWHSWEIVFFLSRHHCSTVGMKGKWPLLLSFSLGRHFPCTHGLQTICHLHLTIEKEGASESRVGF